LVLFISIVMAVALKTYVNTEKLGTFLSGRTRVSILLSVLVGTFTPFCACGTMAVIIGMLTTALPWGPIMAFLTSSPLMSPNGFLMISGIIGLRFAIALTAASIVIGVLSGLATQWIERHTGFLRGQARYLDQARNASCDCSGSPAKEALRPRCGCATPAQTRVSDCIPAMKFTVRETPDEICCIAVPRTRGAGIAGWAKRISLPELLNNFVAVGLKQILLYFSLFVGIGYLVNTFVPSSIVSALLGASNLAAVPLASAVGLPLYLTTESSIPIIQSLLESGASEGAMLAFVISGSATSAWVIVGLTTFMKKRALGLYVACVLMGSILSGYLYELILQFV
jgi:uncharacterized membrane protein YraQ (UPF0718 family)